MGYRPIALHHSLHANRRVRLELEFSDQYEANVMFSELSETLQREGGITIKMAGATLTEHVVAADHSWLRRVLTKIGVR